MKKLLNKIIARNETKKRDVTALEICAEKECPDGGYGWIICIAAAICQFIIMGIHNNFGILYTYFMRDLKADPADTSELLQLQFLSYNPRWLQYTLFFFYKNAFYKNMEAESSEISRIL